MIHIVFRTDISHEAGTGHFMRSLNLAGNLKERGVDVSFITTELPDFFSTMLEQKQIKHFPLSNSSLSVRVPEGRSNLFLLPLPFTGEARRGEEHGAIPTEPKLSRVFSWQRN